MNPYKHLAMLAVLIAAVLSIFAWGRSSGRRAEAADHAPKHAELKRAYDLAHTGLLNAGAALRTVSARTREEAARAAQQQAQGAQAAAEAAEAARAAKARVGALETELKRERATCTQAEARICGVPLR